MFCLEGWHSLLKVYYIGSERFFGDYVAEFTFLTVVCVFLLSFGFLVGLGVAVVMGEAKFAEGHEVFGHH
jgi:hypothetical protein